MKHQIKGVIALVAICAVVALALALTNALTAPTIREAEAAAVEAALKQVLPTGEGFEAMELSAYALPETVTEIYREKNGGYAVKLEATGYSPGMVILCGIDAQGKVVGSTCLSSGETLGYEKTYGSTLVGYDVGSVGSVDTISNATKTTKGYRDAVLDALKAVEMVKEGA